MNKNMCWRSLVLQEQGSVLVFTLMVLTILLVLGSAALNIASTEYQINSVQDRRQNALLGAETALQNAIFELNEGLSNDSFYLKGQDPDTKESEWDNRYDYSIEFIENFLYQIKVTPNNSASNEAQQFLTVTVKANDNWINDVTVESEELPEALKKAIYSVGTIDIVGNAETTGPLHAETGSVIVHGSAAQISGGIISASDMVDLNGCGDITVTEKEGVHIPVAVVNPIFAQRQPDSYIPQLENDRLKVDNIPEDAKVVYIEGNVKLEGHFGNKQVLIYSTGDMTCSASNNMPTDENGGVVLMTAGSFKMTGNAHIYGVIWANNGAVIGGNGSGQAKVDGAIVVNSEGIKVHGTPIIQHDTEIVENLFSKWKFVEPKVTTEITPGYFEIKGLDIVGWKEE